MSDDILNELLSRDDMLLLARELEIPEQEVDSTFAKYACLVPSYTRNLWQIPEPVQQANFEILSNWRNNRISQEEAGFLMREALVRAGLNLIAAEVLNYHPEEAKQTPLSDENLDTLARKLTQKDLERLAPKLDIDINTEVKKTFAKQCKDNLPVFLSNSGVLRRWLNKQNDRYEAYVRLGEAMIHPDVGLNLPAKEVLQYSQDERLGNIRHKTVRIERDDQSLEQENEKQNGSSLWDRVTNSIRNVPQRFMDSFGMNTDEEPRIVPARHAPVECSTAM